MEIRKSLIFISVAVGAESNPAPWTTEEQKLLEQALKTFPVNTPERWEKISEAVPGRSKKDCMKRYKVRCSQLSVNVNHTHCNMLYSE